MGLDLLYCGEKEVILPQSPKVVIENLDKLYIGDLNLA